MSYNYERTVLIKNLLLQTFVRSNRTCSDCRPIRTYCNWDHSGGEMASTNGSVDSLQAEHRAVLVNRIQRKNTWWCHQKECVLSKNVTEVKGSVRSSDSEHKRHWENVPDCSLTKRLLNGSLVYFTMQTDPRAAICGVLLSVDRESNAEKSYRFVYLTNKSF